MFQRIRQFFNPPQSDWPHRARRMMQVCAVALSHINVSSRGRLVRTESASGNTGYVLQLSLPYPVGGMEVLALQAYLRRSIESVMGLQLGEKEFLVQVQDVSAVLPMATERMSTEWLARHMGDVGAAHVERVARETAEAEQARRAKVVPLMRDADPDVGHAAVADTADGLGVHEPGVDRAGQARGRPRSAQPPRSPCPVRSGARKTDGQGGPDRPGRPGPPQRRPVCADRHLRQRPRPLNRPRRPGAGKAFARATRRPQRR